MDNIEENIMRILGTNKIKYNVLDVEFDNIFKKSEMVNIHLDLNSILKPLFSENINNEMEIGIYEYHISSAILNILAHFRAYFVYRQRLGSRIFLYYTDKKLKNDCKYFKQFNSVEYKNVLYAVSKALNLAKVITKYCNKIYFIATDNNDPIVCMNYYINEFTNKVTKNIVVTKDEMLYQLINVKDTNILRLKRDESVLLSSDNIFEFILRNSKYTSKYISTELLSFVMAHSGVATRDVKGVCKTKIIKTIDKLIEDKIILNEYHSKVEYIFDDANLKDRDIVVDNFYNIDLNNLYKKLSIADKENLDSYIVDKFSKNDLRMLNIKYYTGELSIMLEELTLEPNNKTKTEW